MECIICHSFIQYSYLQSFKTRGVILLPSRRMMKTFCFTSLNDVLTDAIDLVDPLAELI